MAATFYLFSKTGVQLTAGVTDAAATAGTIDYLGGDKLVMIANRGTAIYVGSFDKSTLIFTQVSSAARAIYGCCVQRDGKNGDPVPYSAEKLYLVTAAST